MATGTIEEQLKQLREAAAGSQAVALSHAGALTWLAYDILLTTRQEVQLMWRGKVSLLKFLYFAVRYFTLVALIIILAVNTNSQVKFHAKFCEHYTWFYTLSTNFPIFFGEGIMLMRIYALYNKSKKILAFTLVLYLAHVGVSLALTLVTTLPFKVIVPPLQIPIPGCLHNPLPDDNAKLSIPALSFNFVVAVVYFVLTAYKFLSNIYIAEGPGALSFRRIITGNQRSQPVIHLFVRDGSFYFLVIVTAEIIFLYFMVKHNNKPLMIMGQAWEMATYAVSSTRLVLSLSGSLTNTRQTWGKGISASDRSGSDYPLGYKRGGRFDTSRTELETAWSSEPNY